MIVHSFTVTASADVSASPRGGEIHCLTERGEAVVLIATRRFLYNLRDNIDRALAERRGPDPAR